MDVTMDVTTVFYVLTRSTVVKDDQAVRSFVDFYNVF